VNGHVSNQSNSLKTSEQIRRNGYIPETLTSYLDSTIRKQALYKSKRSIRPSEVSRLIDDVKARIEVGQVSNFVNNFCKRRSEFDDAGDSELAANS
jgi:hypothetical protein